METMGKECGFPVYNGAEEGMNGRLDRALQWTRERVAMETCTGCGAARPEVWLGDRKRIDAGCPDCGGHTVLTVWVPRGCILVWGVRPEGSDGG